MRPGRAAIAALAPPARGPIRETGESSGSSSPHEIGREGRRKPGTHLAAGVLCLLVSLAPALAAAQPGRTLVVVPRDAPRRLVEEVRIQLQLTGRRVSIFRGAEDLGRAEELAAHADAEVVALRPRGAEIELLAVGALAPRTVLAPAASTPRALAALLTLMLEEPSPSADAALSPGPTPDPVSPAPTAHVAVSIRGPAAAVRAPEGASRLVAPRPPQRPAEPLAVSPREIRPGLEAEPRLAPVQERIALEVLGAILGGAALGLGGALVADVASGGDPTFPWWAAGLAIGGTVGSSGGALLVGRLTGARGEPLWTILAGLAGGALGGLLMAVGRATDVHPDDGVTSGWTYLGAVLSATLPTVLAVLTFELTLPAAQGPRL